jgi:hypothetical protein
VGPEQPPVDEHGQHEIENRPGGHHQDTLPGRPEAEAGFRRNALAQLVLGAFPCQLDVSAQRNGAKPILRVAVLEPEQLRPESQRENRYADLEQTSHDEVTQFVKENQNSKDENNG